MNYIRNKISYFIIPESNFQASFDALSTHLSSYGGGVLSVYRNGMDWIELWFMANWIQSFNKIQPTHNANISMKLKSDLAAYCARNT